MKRFLKMICIFLFVITVLISSIPSTFVKAKGGKYLEAILPSNVVSPYAFYSKYKVSEVLIISMIMDIYDENNILYNQDEKPIVQTLGNDGAVQFKLLDGVTSEDCLFLISDEIREEMIEEFGDDYFGEYDGVHFSVEKVDVPETVDTLYLDMASTNNFNSSFCKTFNES